MASANINTQLDNHFLELEGTTIYTTCTLSTTRDFEPFWGVTLTLPTGKINDNGQVTIFTTKEGFCHMFIDHLKLISKPFPLLMEKIKALKFNFCGSDSDWEQAIIQQ